MLIWVVALQCISKIYLLYKKYMFLKPFSFQKKCILPFFLKKSNLPKTTPKGSG